MKGFLKINIVGFFFLALLFFCCRQRSKKDKGDVLYNLIPDWVTDSVYTFQTNSFTKDKTLLGRYLFYDRRLSVNNTKACASCHAQQFSFTDNYTKSIGAYGDLHLRNARPLINLIFEKYLTAADSTLHFPEQQINNPMFNQHPVEMGWQANGGVILDRIKEDDNYKKLFSAAYPGIKNPYTIQNIQYAIASFVKSIMSFNSVYDKYQQQKNESLLNQSQKKGRALFFSDSLDCTACHSGINFSQPKHKEQVPFFSTGFSLLTNDSGLYRFTKANADIGKFKTPTLRNLAFTAPYLHDGSLNRLEEVIKLYEEKQNHAFIKPFKLTSQERQDLIQFLLSLSDSTIITNPAYANPFSTDETKSVAH